MFNQLRDSLKHYFTPVQPLPSGSHHFQAPPDADHPYRLHLRLEADGSGLLIINAKTVLHLNPTAAEHAYYLVKGLSAQDAAGQISRRYRVKPEQALQDFQDLNDRILTLVHTPDLDPVTYLDIDRRDPYTTQLSAPYRLDCALTYRLPESEKADSAPTDRVDQELTTAEWIAILDKAWEAGIPQVIFTGGEPTLRPDLVDLITHTQEIGQVSGLLTDGHRLANADYLESLLQSGLDHIMVCVEPENEDSWLALQNVLPKDIHTTVHLTITQTDQNVIDGYLDRLKALGAYSISLSASDSALSEVMQTTRNHVANRHMALVWDLPVPYSDFHPVSLEKDISAPTGAGQAWLYLEPDGDVLPAQGVNHVLGNMLRDPWEKIWGARSVLPTG